MDLASLSTIPVTSDASRRLAELLKRRREAAGAVSVAEQAQREAHREACDASDPVAKMERQAALGDEPPPHERTRLEKALRIAQARAAEPCKFAPDCATQVAVAAT
jgi:hypothetical protein